MSKFDVIPQVEKYLISKGIFISTEDRLALYDIVNSDENPLKGSVTWSAIPGKCLYQGKEHLILSIDLQAGSLDLRNSEATKRGDEMVISSVDMEHCTPVQSYPGEGRAESGVMIIGDDWPGIFLRGDNAIGLQGDLCFIRDITDNNLALIKLNGWIDFLDCVKDATT